MPFIEVRKELKNVLFEQLREDRDDYFEAVVVKNELAKLSASLEKLLGSVISASQIPKNIEESVEEFGGVTKGQTLYFKDDGRGKIIAMLWPWQDGIHTTVKIIKKG